MKESQALRNEILHLRNMGELSKQTETKLLHKLNALEKAMNVVRSCEQLHLCKYVKREGESCTLNNNCKYPNCE